MDTLLRILVPRKIRFETQVAVRHLVSGGGQTLLTVSAVAAGVIIVIFITSLIFGLQQHLTELLTDAIPHVTVTVEELKPKPLSSVPGAPQGPSSTAIEQRAPQLKFIDNYPAVVETIRRLPNVREVAPVVSGQAFISKGANPIGVSQINAHGWGVLALGFVISFIVAYASVAWFMAWVRKRGFTPFAIYRIIVGGLVLAFAAKLSA